jgi:hypothetical protein
LSARTRFDKRMRRMKYNNILNILAIKYNQGPLNLRPPNNKIIKGL